MLTKYLYGFFVLDRWCEVYLLQVNSKYVSKVAAAVLTSQRTSLSLFLFMFLFFTPAQWPFLCLTDACFPGSFKLSQKLFSEKPEESHAAYFSLEIKKVKENVNTVIYLIKSTPLFQSSLSSHHFEKQ